jgi:prepilin-type N-terminal cleavage/methylation domain-containing protein
MNRQARHSGFTIIELLVVLGILVILMGLTFASIFSSGKHNRLLATEHLVADFVRQARHTARSSGSPVVLRIDQEKRTISGVSRACLWSDLFEAAPASSESGMTGNGLLRAIDESEKIMVTFDRIERLVRKSSPTRTEGFYLSCAIRPPLPNGVVAPIHLPLINIGPSTIEADSLCGMSLLKEELTVTVPGPGTGTAKTNIWTLSGWAKKASGTVYVYSDTLAKAANGDMLGPISGDRWEEFGLLFDGQRLVLYRNGQQIGDAALDAANSVLLSSVDTENVYVGQMTYTGDGTTLTNCAAVLDDARIYRLSTDQLGNLPRGVIPAKDEYRVVAHPDGRVELFPAGASGEMIFEGDFTNNGTIGKAIVTVTIDGKVSSKIEPQ